MKFAVTPFHAHRLLRALGLVLAALLLGLIFMAYLQPEFMLELANRIMLC